MTIKIVLLILVQPGGDQRVFIFITKFVIMFGDFFLCNFVPTVPPDSGTLFVFSY